MEARWLALYRKGLTDRQIGNEVHRSEKTIRDWRERAGLPPNEKPKSRLAELRRFWWRRFREAQYGGVQ